MHTCMLESFHNELLIYISKRISFSHDDTVCWALAESSATTITYTGQCYKIKRGNCRYTEVQQTLQVMGVSGGKKADMST